METLSGISDEELTAEIARLQDIQNALREEVKKLNRIRKLIGKTSVNEDKPTSKKRVPRGLYERIAGLFERSAGDKFTAVDLASQLGVQASDVLLCIERNANRFFKIGHQFGFRQVGK